MPFFPRSLDIHTWTAGHIILSGIFAGVLTGVIFGLVLTQLLPDTDPEPETYE